MEQFFFSGATSTKLDEKNRFVLPQHMRYGLIEQGKLEFTLGLGLGGSLAIYRRSEINAIVKRLQSKIHVAKYRQFFTVFFSTLYHTSCDKLGRVLIPHILKKAAKIDQEIVIAGVLNRIEIWSRKQYEYDLETFLNDNDPMQLLQMTEEMMHPKIEGCQMNEELKDETELSCFSHDQGDDPRF